MNKPLKRTLLSVALGGLLAAPSLLAWAAPATPPAVGSAAATTIEVPGGGSLWVTEDPELTAPQLTVQAGGMAALEQGRITRPITFFGYANYAAFMTKLQVQVYRGDDTDRVHPLATVDLPLKNVSEAAWDGTLPADVRLQPGDELIYVARAYDAQGNFDETVPQRLQLVIPQDYERGLQRMQDQVRRNNFGLNLEQEQAQALQINSGIYGTSSLRVQNIPVYGSRVRIYGYDIPRDVSLSIDGQSFPVDLERKFVAEFLQPIGMHRYQVRIEGGQESIENALDVTVTGEHRFLVAIADATWSKNNVSGDIAPMQGDYHYRDGFLSEGRLAFYWKEKRQGKYLITAHADTTERRTRNLFSGLLKADPSGPLDVFRNLDPDQYYPVYGDDSTTWRDVDTQGRLYLRVDWDQNQALWGNFQTGITGTQYGQYNRSLYGGALSWRSRDTTVLGEPNSQLKVFGSQVQSAAGHNEFLGTGGSLYYLRNTNVLPGSDKVVLEIRDPDTGNVENRVTLVRGADYDIDSLSGRLYLNRPLAQITRENVLSLTRDRGVDGFEQRLVVDYEYAPQGFDADEVSKGFRGKQWLGEHVAFGATYVDEGRSGASSYQLAGVDMTLQQGRGTYLKVERDRSRSTAVSNFYSDNGGLSFALLNPPTAVPREGHATAIEARVNLRELGWTTREWSAGAWWRDADQGFSATRADLGLPVREYGGQFLGYATDTLSLSGQYSYALHGEDVLEQMRLLGDWRLTPDDRWSAELKRQRQVPAGQPAIGATLLAMQYQRQLTPRLDGYVLGQYTLDDDDGRYPANNRVALGADYQWGDRSQVSAEVSDGSRGHAAQATAEYSLNPQHMVYGTYTYSADRTVDPLYTSFAPRNQPGLTLGQRWQLTNRANLYNETTFLREGPSQQQSGLAHTFGMDFYPSLGWTVGYALGDARLDSVTDGTIRRRSYSVSGGRTDERVQWASRLEYRRDTGMHERSTWATTNRLGYRVNEDWRLALNANHSNTQDSTNADLDAEYTEINGGFAFRPHDNTAWALFGKYTYLYDLATLAQAQAQDVEGGTAAVYDQRNQVLSLEGIYQFAPRWELGGKLAANWGDYRMGRGNGAWVPTQRTFAALQMRYEMIAKWDAVLEHRRLHVGYGGGTKTGWLVSVDRHIAEHLRLGIGYNFTEFSDDLTVQDYRNRGWFLNVVGTY